MICGAYSTLGSIGSGLPAASSALVASYSRSVSRLRWTYSPSMRRKYSTASSSRMIQGRYSAECSLDSVGKQPSRLYSSTLTCRRSSGVALDRHVQERVEILAVALEAQDPRLVVDARSQERDVLERHADVLGELARGVLDRVAEADHAPLWRAGVGRPAQHRHRVGVVEQPGVRAELGHVGGDSLHHRDRPQRPEDAADAERVADRLAESVARSGSRGRARSPRGRRPGSC